MRVGIWERDEGIRTAVEAGLGELAAEVRAGRHPAELVSARLEPLTVSPAARGWVSAGAVPCGTVLAARHGRAAGPGPQRPPGRELRHLPRDTLTFSSLEGDRLCLAVQRELVTLGGAVVEQQELVLPFSTGASPLPFLAAAGTLLLLGVPPEELPARFRLPA
ncbi:MAG: hypothetical protein ACLRNQ_00115 [Flavonifractor plautii]